MAKDLITPEDAPALPAVAAPPPSTLPAMQQMFAMALEAARDPDIDANKMKLLVDMATTQQDREAERRFRIAKQRALLEMPSITQKGAIRNRNNEIQSRYSRFEDMHRIIKPILAKYNLTISFNISHHDQMVTVQPILAYADADVAYEERGSEMVLAVDTTGSKNATQGAGSAASYGKRHSLKAMLNIVEGGEDDDGQGAAPLALPSDKLELIEAARKAAEGGTEAYQAYFASLDKDDRGFLTYSVAETGMPFHEQNKRSAALFD